MDRLGAYGFGQFDGEQVKLAGAQKSLKVGIVHSGRYDRGVQRGILQERVEVTLLSIILPLRSPVMGENPKGALSNAAPFARNHMDGLRITRRHYRKVVH